MDYGRVDRGQGAIAAILLVAVGAAALAPAAFEPSPGLRTVFVDPVLRSEILAAGAQPAILVLDAAKAEAIGRRLADLGLAHHALRELHMVAIVLDAATLDTVSQLSGVVSVYRNEHMRPLLDRSADYVGAKTVWNTYDVTGQGVTVLVMDSGIDARHPDLAYGTKVVQNVVPSRVGVGLVGGSREGVVASDPDGHGTHVAGIVAAGDDKGAYRGIAPGASLIGYQAGLPDAKTGDIEFESLTVLEGFNWALANRDKYGIDIVSNSWGANGDFDPRSPVNIATLSLYKAGLLVLFAAGNEGNEGRHTLNKYSVAPWVLSVTAGDYFNQVPDFSSRGTRDEPYDHPDIVAPGVSITSTRALNSDLPPADDEGLYATKSGSSMSTPHVAGIAALLLQANPELSPDDLMDILTATATSVRAPIAEAGAGYVNGLRAYQLAMRAIGHRDAFLAGHVKYAGPSSGDADYAEDSVTVGYLRGQASRLRSPDTSVPGFLADLFTTARGVTFLGGALLLGALAFGRARQNPSPWVAPPPPSPNAPRRVEKPSVPLAMPPERAVRMGRLVHFARQEDPRGAFAALPRIPPTFKGEARPPKR